MIKIFSALLTIILILTGGYFIYHHVISNGKNQEKQSVITIGWIGPLTGPVKILGVDNLKAVQLAFSEYENNKSDDEPTLKLIVSDDQYDADRTVLEYTKMVQSEKPVAIILSTYSAIAKLSKEALKDSVVLIDSVDNDLNLASLNTPWKANIFLIAKETEGLASIVANAIIAENKKNTVVIYYDGDAFMPTLANTVNQILKSTNRQVQLFGYKKGTTDFSPFLKWGKTNHADSYVFFGYEDLAIAMEQARNMGITASFYASNFITTPIFQEENIHGAKEGTVFGNFTLLDGNKLKTEEFLENFWKTYHERPPIEWVAMQAYDATNILIQAVKETYRQEKNAMRELFNMKLRDVLMHVSDYQGVSGAISIKPNGASVGIYFRLYILKGNKSVPYTVQ